MGEAWRNDLCDCCSDPSIFCLVCYFRHCVQGHAVNLIEGEGCYGPCFAASCFCCFGEANNREKIRKHFGIGGSYGEDCQIMCRLPLCGTIQMYKEVMDRLGHGLVAVQYQPQPGQYQPPEVPPGDRV